MDLPEAARAGALHADDEFGGLAGLAVDGVGDDGGHDGADEADADDDDDLAAHLALLGDDLLKPLEFAAYWSSVGRGNFSPSG